VLDDPSLLRDPARDQGDGDEPCADAASPPLARVSSLREVQRARIEAEARRLMRFESQLANLQLMLRADQARLAIDRLRFAVHGLCGTMPPADCVEVPSARRLVRVK